MSRTCRVQGCYTQRVRSHHLAKETTSDLNPQGIRRDVNRNYCQ